MAHHFQPGWDENFFTRKTILDKFKSDSFIERLKDFIKLSGYTLYFRPKFLKEMKNNYKVAYEFADATVLLADDFINEYADYAEINDKSKFHVIPNALSYPEYFYDIGRYGEKKKSVLIVSRMDEPPKKISIALRIWKMIKEKEESKDWVLNLVGDGPDLSRYIRMVEEENIKDVFFWGRQIPDAFYENASIFMMTSESEGWGLTLTESQQFGVVPVVFNTSNAFREIIDDGITGILIDPGDYEGYVNAMCILMTDEVKRKNIALGAYYSCNKFSQKKVAENWHELFEAIRLD